MRRLAYVFGIWLSGCAPLAELPFPAAYESMAKAPAVERFAQVAEGMYRGGAIQEMGQMRDLKGLGVRTVINLQNMGYRSERAEIVNEERLAKEAGIRFINLSMTANAAPSPDFARKVLGILTDPAMRPVYIHCKRGRDRTGTMVGAYRLLEEGWSAKQAVQEMESFGFDRNEYPFFVEFLFGLEKSRRMAG